MGRKKTVVGTSIQRVIKDENLPNSIQQGVVQAIFGNESVPESVMESLFGSIGMKAEQMYHYAKSAQYPWGVPEYKMRTLVAGREIVQSVIEDLEGSPITMDYIRLAPGNYIHGAWMTLVLSYGYDYETNELTTLSDTEGTPVYLHDMALHIPPNQFEEFNPSVLEVWGPAASAGPTVSRKSTRTSYGSISKATPVVLNPAVPSPKIFVEISYKRLLPERTNEPGEFYPIGSEKIRSIEIPILAVDDSKEYYQVRYTVNNIVKFWRYSAGTGTYPVLDEFVAPDDNDAGTFYPYLYFRYDFKSEVENKTTDAYRTSKSMAKMLNIDYDNLSDTIDENPDIGEVIQAILTFGINPDTTDPTDCKYLFKFFENLYYEQEPDKQFSGFSSDRVVNGHNGAITDGWNNAVFDIADKRFRMQFQAKAMYRDMKTGQVTAKGKYTGGKGKAKYPFTVYTPIGEGEFELAIKEQDIDYYYYQYQITDNLYIEMKVFGLESLYYIQGDKKTSSDEIDNILIVPLDREIIKDWSVAEKEIIFSRSLHFIFNSLKVIKLKWYQTGIFQIIMIVISVVVSIFLSPAVGAAFQTAMAAGTTAVISFLAIQLLTTLFISVVIGEIVKVFAKVFGSEIAFIIAIIGIVVGIVNVIDPTLLAGFPPWANHLLDLASNLKSTLISAGFEEMMEDLYGDFNSWLKDTEELNKTLEAGQNLLKEHHHLSPFVIFGERPEDFYNRTIHMGNPGAISIAAVGYYVESALQLPKINDTLGETLMGGYSLG